MKKVIQGIKKVEGYMMVLLMIAMTIIIFVATVARFTNLFVISWAEEFARYCMIWIIFLGIGVAAEDGEHFCVEALGLFCPKKVLQAVEVLKDIFTVGFCVFTAYWGFYVVNKQIASGQVTPSLRWPMWLMYISIPVGLIIMGIMYVYHSAVIFKTIGDKPSSTKEAEDAVADAKQRELEAK